MKTIKFAILALALSVSANIVNPVASAQTQTKRSAGTVKWFNDAKGYGFITSTTGEELFVHFRAIMGTGFKTLKEGAKVTFKRVQGQKGVQAEEVQAL